jgi:hypothetical protein
MTNRSNKGLTLHRESLRQLTSPQLAGARGGFAGTGMSTSCDSGCTLSCDGLCPPPPTDNCLTHQMLCYPPTQWTK